MLQLFEFISKFFDAEENPKEHESEINNESKKKISFSPVCKVILVPTKEEYKDAGIVLWHANTVYKENKDVLQTRIQQVSEKNPELPVQDIVKIILCEEDDPQETECREQREPTELENAAIVQVPTS